MVRQYLLLLIMFFDWLGKQTKMDSKAFNEFKISKPRLFRQSTLTTASSTY